MIAFIGWNIVEPKVFKDLPFFCDPGKNITFVHRTTGSITHRVDLEIVLVGGLVGR